MAENKNDNAREFLFEKYNILEEVEKNWEYIISAKVITPVREARLMTKFDHKEDIPKIFSKNNLSILPITRWTYVIGHFETHEDLQYDYKHIQNIEPRNDLESLDKNNLFSESLAINYALAAWMFQNLLNEFFEPTISWRMKSSKFSFKVMDNQNNSQKIIEVNNAQIEIDWGFESESKLLIIEAKMGKWDDFIVRQLYYPYRLWKQKVSKDVIPVFMTFSNDVFTFFVYKFEDDNDYNSIKLVKQKSFAIDFEPVSLPEVKKILASVKSVPEPDAPFPQADDFEKVINLLEILQSWEKTDDELAEEYNFVIRQSRYYKNAAKYLWYATFERWKPLKITEKGKKLMNLPRRERLLSVIKEILSHPAFSNSFKEYLACNWDIKKYKVVEIMKKSKLRNIWGSTYDRRAQSVMSWCEWIYNTTEESY